MTPTEFLIDAMEGLDDVKDVTIIRRYKDGCIGFDCASHSRFDLYAMVCATKASLDAAIVKTEFKE